MIKIWQKVTSKIAVKLSLIMSLLVLIIFLISGIIIFNFIEKKLMENTIKEMKLSSNSISEHIADVFEDNKIIIEQMSTNNEVTEYLKNITTKEEIKKNTLFPSIVKTLDSIKKSNDLIYSTWVANDKANFYVNKNGETSKENYNVKERPWYKQAVDSEGVVFTLPYISSSDETVVSAVQALRENNEVIGFTAVDISLNTIPNIMSKHIIGEKGTNILIANDGTYIYSENEEKIMKTKIFEDEVFKEYAQKMISGESDIVEITYNNREYYFSYVPIEVNKWSVGLLIDKEEVLGDLKNMMTIISCLFVFGALLLIIVLYIVIKKNIKGIEVASSHAKLMGSGDFSRDVPRAFLNKNDEIGELAGAFDEMTHNFRDLIGKITNSSNLVVVSSKELTTSAEQVTIASEEVARTIEEIAKGATEQARDTEEGSGKAYELGSIIEKEQECMRSVNDSSSKVVKLIDEGLEVVNGLTKKTTESGNAISEIGDVIIEVNKSSSKIGEASNLIASIAEQTNLLALNAAIEAARAGESGKGFAVVAEEIRKLAEQSTASTKEIDNIVNELVKNSSNAVTTMNSVSKIVEEQIESVKDTETKYKDIAGAIQKSEQAVETLNISGKEMEQKKNEILNIIQNLSAIAQENAAGSEEAAALTEEQSASIEEIANSSEGLLELAEELEKAISVFKI